jgi:hypothetical protein
MNAKEARAIAKEAQKEQKKAQKEDAQKEIPKIRKLIKRTAEDGGNCLYWGEYENEIAWNEVIKILKADGYKVSKSKMPGRMFTTGCLKIEW